MGETSGRYVHRSSVTLPTKAWASVYQKAKAKGLVPRIRRVPKGGDIAQGTKPRLVGETDIERYIHNTPVEATIPEKLVFAWLKLHGYTFEFQAPIMGGRTNPGGAVADFVVYDMLPALIIRVQSYWHTTSSQKYFDDSQYSDLTIMGYRVEDVWEWDINTIEKLNITMREVMVGTYGGGGMSVYMDQSLMEYTQEAKNE